MVFLEPCTLLVLFAVESVSHASAHQHNPKIDLSALQTDINILHFADVQAGR